MARMSHRLSESPHCSAHLARRYCGVLAFLAAAGVATGVDLSAQATNVTVERSTSVPTTVIETGWEAGNAITSVTGASDGYWTVVMSDRSGYDGQSYRSSTSWPRDFIREQWDAGNDITEFAYANGGWLVVSSAGADFAGQRWALSGNLSEELAETLELGYDITDVAYGGGSWVVVGSNVPSYDDQVYTTSSTFPTAFVREKWDDGYRITEWYYGGGTWVVVMTELASNPSQGYSGWSSIEDAWAAGRQVLDIAYNGSSYRVVTTASLGEAMGFPPPSGGILEASVASSSSRSATFTVDVFVVGSDSELLTLSDADFVLDDGALGTTGTNVDYSLTSVQVYRQASAGPYSAMFLLDQSGSITSSDPTDVRIDAAKVFKRNLGTGDEVGLMAFASNGSLPHSPVTIWTSNGSHFSSNASAFDSTLDSLADLEGGGTPLYDASNSAVATTAAHANNTNRVVIVFTDGEDTSSSASLNDAIQNAKQQNIPLHTVALSDGVDIGVLSRMAGETGGSLTYATDARRLISYYGALGPYLSGAGSFYRTTWSVLAQGGTFTFNRGSWMTDYIEIEIPGTNIYLPFRLAF